MDIYEYAESINYSADYLDQHTGYIYCIQDYKRLGLPQIPITDNGRIIGYAVKKDSKKEERMN